MSLESSRGFGLTALGIFSSPVKWAVHAGGRVLFGLISARAMACSLFQIGVEGLLSSFRLSSIIAFV